MNRYYANPTRVKTDPDSWHDDLDRVVPDLSLTDEIRADMAKARAIAQARLEVAMRAVEHMHSRIY